jgi:nicotinate-nucleotide adenylyltransferase
VAKPIGVLGGSFDPVHNGHVVLGILASEQLALERLLVIPARESPHKIGVDAAPPGARLELARLAFANVPGVDVSDVEIRRPPPSYTVDTVDAISRQHAGKEIILLLGTDALSAFPRWRDAPAIAARCRLAVFRRPPGDSEVLGHVLQEVPGLRARWLDTPAIEISSTVVRERARAGLTLAGFVPDAVAAAIVRLRLYAPR